MDMFGEEKASKKPAIEVLKGLGYNYINPDAIEKYREDLYDPLLKPILRENLAKINSYEYRGEIYKFDKSIIDRAIKDLDIDLSEGLIRANEKIYELLIYGKSYRVLLDDGVQMSFNFKYIDWDNIDNNEFSFTEEYVVARENGRDNIRVDLVTFINGIPLTTMELKRPSVPVREGISQTIRNQGKDYCPNLFKYIQLTLASNKNEFKYGTCGTPEKFWSIWREEDKNFLESKLGEIISSREPSRQDKDIISLLSKERFLEIMRFFTVFDKNVKKVARYQQYFGVKEILKTIEERDDNGNRKSGVIWHTQGSGKSLTMVMLSKYIFSIYGHLKPKVIVVTDRIDLDNQIYKTFSHTSLRPNKATTGRHLVKLIEDDGADIITSLVHKFETAANIARPVESQDIFILVDESHRTQYGKLHSKMRKIFPNASYLGFTGTPLMKEDKNTMMKFGGLIHTYTIADAVKDKTILPLYYEGLMVDQSVNQKAIDTNLEIITRRLDEADKRKVMERWSAFSRLASSDQRIGLISFRINQHFLKSLKSTGFNAMLATDKKIDAIRYKEHFDDLGDLRTEVVISKPDMREGHDELDKESKKLEINFWNKMMDKYGDESSYESSIKENFIAGDIDILIVVDKLLTGFDAPLAQVLYIDKPLKEHTLLQAIARVNRLSPNKDRGIIIDFRGLLTDLNNAMEVYSGAGLEKFDPKDLKNALYDSLEVIGELRQDHSNLLDIFRSVKNKEDIELLELSLAEEDIRKDFYKKLSKLKKSLDLAISLDNVYNKIEPEITSYEKDYKFYTALRKNVSLRYGDKLDFDEYDPQMQKIMDQHVAAEGISRITYELELTDKEAFKEELQRLDSDASMADAIRSRLTRTINDSYNRDPYYYKKFSQMIDDTLNKYRDKRISEKEYFEEMSKHLDNFEKKTIISYPDLISDDDDSQAFYGNIYGLVCEDDEAYGPSQSFTKDDLGEISKEVKEIIISNKKVDWHKNTDVNNKIEQEIEDLLYDFYVSHGLEPDWEKIDKLNDGLRKIALERY